MITTEIQRRQNLVCNQTVDKTTLAKESSNLLGSSQPFCIEESLLTFLSLNTFFSGVGVLVCKFSSIQLEISGPRLGVCFVAIVLFSCHTYDSSVCNSNTPSLSLTAWNFASLIPSPLFTWVSSVFTALKHKFMILKIRI